MLWWIVGGVAIITVLGVIILIARRRQSDGALTSLVLMRATPTSITEDQVRAAAKAAFKDEGDVIALPRDRFPPGLAGGYAITLMGSPVFYVINAHNTYVPDPQAESAKFTDARARQAFATHKAWVSVDVVGGLPEPSMQQMVLMSMAVVAIKLMDAQTSLIYSTWLDRAAFPADMRKAAGGNINAVFAA